MKRAIPPLLWITGIVLLLVALYKRCVVQSTYGYATSQLQVAKQIATVGGLLALAGFTWSIVDAFVRRRPPKLGASPMQSSGGDSVTVRSPSQIAPNARPQPNSTRSIVWMLLGGLCGGILGILATLALTALVVLLSPGDPSAGSVGIVIIGFLPGGVIMGLAGGLLASKRKWRP
jgi:hypothetical protein